MVYFPFLKSRVHFTAFLPDIEAEKTSKGDKEEKDEKADKLEKDEKTEKPEPAKAESGQVEKADGDSSKAGGVVRFSLPWIIILYFLGVHVWKLFLQVEKAEKAAKDKPEKDFNVEITQKHAETTSESKTQR